MYELLRFDCIYILNACTEETKPAVNYWDSNKYIDSCDVTWSLSAAKNRPWFSPLWLDNSDIMTSSTSFRCWSEKCCNCFLVSIFALKPKFFVKQWMENNIDINNKYHLFNVHWGINNSIWSRARFTWTPSCVCVWGWGAWGGGGGGGGGRNSLTLFATLFYISMNF